jgi:hypothetical protein
LVFTSIGSGQRRCSKLEAVIDVIGIGIGYDIYDSKEGRRDHAGNGLQPTSVRIMHPSDKAETVAAITESEPGAESERSSQGVLG